MIMNNFPWLFEKLFECITVQTMLHKQSSNKPKIPEMFWWRLLQSSLSSSIMPAEFSLQQKYHNSACLTTTVSWSSSSSSLSLDLMLRSKLVNMIPSQQFGINDTMGRSGWENSHLVTHVGNISASQVVIVFVWECIKYPVNPAKLAEYTQSWGIAYVKRHR